MGIAGPGFTRGRSQPGVGVSADDRPSDGMFFVVSRSCARPECGGIAVATMSYAYADSLVILEDLTAEDHPMVHDLCAMHASSVRVPRGWDLEDARASAYVGQSEHDGALRLVGA